MTRQSNRKTANLFRMLGDTLAPALAPALAIALLSGHYSIAHAVEISDSAQAIKVGEGDLYLSGSVGYRVDDNRDRVNENPTDLNGVVFSPAVVYQAGKGSLNFESSYEGGFGSFDDSSFDFDDHRVAISLGTELSRRWGVGTNVNFSQSHDDFDNVDGGGVIIRDSFVVIQNSSVDVGFRFGAQGAKGNIEGSLLYFTNDVEELDFALSGITPDHDLIEPSLQFSLRLSQDTRFTLGVRHGLFDFDQSDDRTITRTLLGLQFSPTGQFRGFFRIGQATTRFDSGSRDSETDFVFNSVITYLPASFARFVFRGERRLDNRDSSAIDFSGAGTTSDIVSLTWIHSWGARFSTNAFVRLELTDRVCPASSDDLSVYGVRANYQLFNKVSLGLGVQQESQTGDLCPEDQRAPDIADYDRQLIDVSVSFTL